jgi:hypothetical protein
MAEFWRQYFDAVIEEPCRSERERGIASRFAAPPDGDRIELMPPATQNGRRLA